MSNVNVKDLPGTIAILSTGGTIDKFYAPLKGNLDLGEPAARAVLSRASVTAPVRVDSILKKDSLDISDVEREAICARIIAEPSACVIVTHGTDTMIQTARLLTEKLKTSPVKKTILFTGAMVPDSYCHSDAAFNIGFALGVIHSLAPGAYIAMNGEVFDPFRVRKNYETGHFEREG